MPSSRESAKTTGMGGARATIVTDHTSSMMSLAFSPDGKTLASGSGDKTVRLYVAATDEDVERQRSR